MNRYGPFVHLVLECLDLDTPFLPLESLYDFAKRKNLRGFTRDKYTNALWKMNRSGYLKIIKKNDQKFLKITNKGQLEKLLQKAGLDVAKNWDGKWRVIIFDIPESFHHLRDHFRWMLKKNNFKKLQASVFISPYPLNRDAIQYLTETKLINFIRIIKVEEMDNDKDLRKMFNL
ncbi:MAG: hypothetical protein HY918_01480 [Candidatus Doudnabacteria bacterium]|nr:hypothetical protein [Candidatus Doudnabacteria bacterium]